MACGSDAQSPPRRRWAAYHQSQSTAGINDGRTLRISYPCLHACLGKTRDGGGMPEREHVDVVGAHATQSSVGAAKGSWPLPRLHRLRPHPAARPFWMARSLSSVTYRWDTMMSASLCFTDRHTERPHRGANTISVRSHMVADGDPTSQRRKGPCRRATSAHERGPLSAWYVPLAQIVPSVRSEYICVGR